MEKFATLEPVRLYASSGARLLSRGGNANTKPTPAPALIGRLPVDIHRLILSFLPIADVPAYARSSRALNNLVKDDKFWEARWLALGVEKYNLGSVLDALEAAQKGQAEATRAALPPTLSTSNDLDDFGDFASADTAGGDYGDFVGAAQAPPPLAITLGATPPHLVLSALSAPLHPASSSSSTPTADVPLRTRAKALHLLALFVSPHIQPLRAWPALATALRAATDRFDAALLAAFDSADGRADEAAMREAAEASWETWADEGDAQEKWEMGKVWAEKREIFYVSLSGRWDPRENFTEGGGLSFDAMDEFMREVVRAVEEHGARAVRVFPPESRVLLGFAERVAGEVVGEYIASLLTRARAAPASAVFLQATAASFKEAWRMVDAIMHAAGARERQAAEAKEKQTEVEAEGGEVPIVRAEDVITRTQAEDVVYRMFESNMDEYLDEEVESVKLIFETICKDWDRQLSTYAPSTTTAAPHTPHAPATNHQPRFLASQNPAQVKRNVLASFTSVLLLPVTIVPRTVGAVGGAIVSGGTAAAQGIAMLNPARWGGGGGGMGVSGGVARDRDRVSKTGWGAGAGAGNAMYKGGVGGEEKNGNGSMVFEVGEEEADADEEDEKSGAKGAVNGAWEDKDEDPWGAGRATASRPASTATASSTSATRVSTPTPTPTPTAAREENKLELLLSLDVALEVIHADREALKRVETFAGYPGHYGHRVRDTIEEIFVLMLGALGEGHLRKGFARATEQMREYRPAEHAQTTSVAPLLQFFELVHVGDTIQSMVQVYFDKELAHHIDRTDFLNAVVREKKRFENALDDSVAGGLNAGTEVLMNQVEHIILTLTGPREYYPEEGPLDLGPTRGCAEAIKCLEMHCRLLKGSTSKEVLEVFYQEVGIRLIAILQKHIKRQIISLNGGFRVIADLNTYHAFISSLKVPSIVADFSHLKMLGHVYVVEDAKDLAQIVRDVTRYGGAYRPEDIYEFIQRRSDWKKIEKTVDKTMYNLSFKEDCVVC
ncbi:putative exocyst complex component Sec10 [Lyophyllum shimeji]|uniref:Exocyst complex component Sec10 n=1 Tax=Lyophyllum shimeji TaxID=47721 RepID=A0A9P3PM23_LYOSH|nr:putative exocyst complex component Sec10 [Lyophyllum shimeji]